MVLESSKKEILPIQSLTPTFPAGLKKLSDTKVINVTDDCGAFVWRGV